MASEVRSAINWRGITKTGLAYGGGLMAGNIVSQLLFSVFSPDVYGALGEAARLIIGIGLVMLITGIGGAIGGFLGGWTLPVIGEPKGQYGYAWRSAISIGVVYGRPVHEGLSVGGHDYRRAHRPAPGAYNCGLAPHRLSDRCQHCWLRSWRRSPWRRNLGLLRLYSARGTL